jgi:hypothetical protein
MADMVCRRCRRTIGEADAEADSWKSSRVIDAAGYTVALCGRCLKRKDEHFEDFMDRVEDETPTVREAMRLTLAASPVSCARCGRTVKIADDELDDWVAVARTQEGIVLSCPDCATVPEREAHQAQPHMRLRRASRAARELTKDAAAWGSERRAASASRLAELVAEIKQACVEMFADERPDELVCIECGGRSPAGAEGWKAYLGGIPNDGEIGVYCPGCASREFGDQADASRHTTP